MNKSKSNKDKKEIDYTDLKQVQSDVLYWNTYLTHLRNAYFLGHNRVMEKGTEGLFFKYAKNLNVTDTLGLISLARNPNDSAFDYMKSE